MSHHTAAWVAWSLCALYVALIGLALVLDFLTGKVVLPRICADTDLTLPSLY